MSWCVGVVIVCCDISWSVGVMMAYCGMSWCGCGDGVHCDI